MSNEPREPGHLEPPPPKAAKRLSDFEGEVLAHYATSPRNTREGMRYAFLHLKRICGDLALDEVSFATIERFKRVRQAEGKRPNTVNNNLRCLSAALTYAKDLGYVPAKPKIKLVKVNRENPRILSQPEVENLLRKPHGVREDCPPHGIEARRDHSWPPLSPKDGLVVPLSKNQVEDWFHRHTTYTAHRLRHTFASRYIQNRGSVTKLQKILGHASIQTTMIYVHLTPEDLRSEIEQLPCLPAGVQRASPV